MRIQESDQKKLDPELMKQFQMKEGKAFNLYQRIFATDGADIELFKPG